MPTYALRLAYGKNRFLNEKTGDAKKIDSPGETPRTTVRWECKAAVRLAAGSRRNTFICCSWRTRTQKLARRSRTTEEGLAAVGAADVLARARFYRSSPSPTYCAVKIMINQVAQGFLTEAELPFDFPLHDLLLCGAVVINLVVDTRPP